MGNTAQRAKTIWNALNEEARDVLCRINVRQAISEVVRKPATKARKMISPFTG